RHSAATPEVQKEEEKKFKEVGEAFTVLSDPKKKMRYDNGHDLEDDGSFDGGGPVLSSDTMSAKAISEQTGKEFLYKYICSSAAVQNRFRYANITPETDWDRLTQDHPWLLTEVSLLRLVVKPDQLIKRRGKLGLVGINLDLQGVKEWLKGQLMKETTEEEFYVCIYATRDGDQVLFHHEGGVEVGDVDTKAQRLTVAVDDKLSDAQVKKQLLTHVPDDKKAYGHGFVLHALESMSVCS
ncbi:hypothetical protein XENOCAPTIV_014635, partial [Xenoophorus captivus]